VKIVSRKRLIKEVIAAFGAALLLGGFIAIPAATVLTLYFPEKLLVPIYSYSNCTWTQVRIVPPGQMGFVGVYLNYGDSMAGAYFSSIRVNAYIMDSANFYNYIQGATFFTPIIKGQPSSYSLFGYTASAPGFYYLVVENYSPYPAFIVVNGAMLSTLVIPMNNYPHYVSTILLHIALITTLLGVVFYLPIRIGKNLKREIKGNHKKDDQID
jgi:hypothetical protein